MSLGGIGILLWDFDGTLAWRSGYWAECAMEAIGTLCPGTTLDMRDIVPHFKAGFPWHHFRQPHPHLADTTLWWNHIETRLRQIFNELGLSNQSGDLARLVHILFADAARWTTYPETKEALRRLSEQGWRHFIVSNHIPELPKIIDEIGLSSFIEASHTSALTGFEKPHPDAFRVALKGAGDFASVWMIGDNPVGDILGARMLGIPGILVIRGGSARVRSWVEANYPDTEIDWDVVNRRVVSNLLEIQELLDDAQ